MLAPVAELARALGRLGIGNQHQVVLYSTTDANWATRAWWVLRCAGFDRAAVLDGGFRKWTAEGRPVSAEPCGYSPERFVPKPRLGLMCDRDAVLAAIDDPSRILLNALTRERHAGTGGMHYGRPGRIRGSANLPSRDLIDAQTGTFRASAELKRLFARVGVTPEREVIAYCGGGIAASALTFALTLLEHDRMRLYDGSLQEWAADERLPMEHD
jgi:thiosulfate/3-mercaptopyruvate sulfurtransferase